MGMVLCLHQALCLLFSFFHFRVISSSPFSSSSLSTQLCPPDQSLALLQFKNTFTIDCSTSPVTYDGISPKIVSWKKGTDCCTWYGVTCDRLTGYVIGLDLSGSCLNGKIHSNSSLFLLPHLRKLNLTNNNFNGSFISSKFGRFTSLKHLDLSSSWFDGLVPSEISFLSKLVSLDLSKNYILRIDQHIFQLIVKNLTKIKYMFLDSVDMSLVVPSSFLNLSSSLISLGITDAGLRGNMPENVFHLPHLQGLSLQANNLSGTLPKFNWSSSLWSLDLSDTSFSGELADSIGNLKFLKNLNLQGCKFTKSIPASLGNLTQITEIDLSYNNFVGLIPSSFSNLVQLTSLDLSFNNFIGQIPDVFGNFSKITKLCLSNNSFNGQLPSSAFSLKQPYDLDLSSNKLEGPLPHQVSGLSNLISLKLGHNLLNGTLPSWLFTLPSLQSLDLTNNKFTGLVDQFQQPNALENVFLGNNEIHGSIPSSIFYLLQLEILDLSSNNLSGIIEPHMLSKLKNLEELDLSNNSLLSFRGRSSVNYTFPNLMILRISSCNISEFPDFLRTLENLTQLDLSNNQINGRIFKRELEGLQSLIYLNISYNFLTGLEQLPGKNLRTVDLRSNLLEGQLLIPPPSIVSYLILNNSLSGEIPSLICNLSSLEFLDLSSNKLSGMIPKCLGNFSSDLSVLNLRMNNFHGNIPGTFSKGNSLRYLELNGNQLEGPLPPSLVHCSKLEVLDLGNNKINDTFPHWLESLLELQVLILRSNRFHGQIGNSKNRFSFTKLRIIDLSHNEFTGLLPTGLFENLQAMMNVDEQKAEGKYMGDTYYEDSVNVTMKGVEIKMEKILTIFTTIDLSSNRFQGQLSEVIGKFKSLIVLNFSHNSLTGHIPSSFGNIIALESLDLSWNILAGEIPVELTSLTFLEVLNLSNNQLVGPIPRGNQFDTFENDSYGGNSRLCGLPLLEKCCNDEAPQPLPSVSHEDEDSGSGFDWKIIKMGYGCGLVLGLSIGYFVPSTGKPQWFVRLVEGDQHNMVRRRRQRRSGRRN